MFLKGRFNKERQLEREREREREREKERYLTNDFEICDENCRGVSRNLAKVGAVVECHGRPDPQPPVVGRLLQLHGVPQVGAEGVLSDRQHAQARILTPEP